MQQVNVGLLIAFRNFLHVTMRVQLNFIFVECRHTTAGALTCACKVDNNKFPSDFVEIIYAHFVYDVCICFESCGYILMIAGKANSTQRSSSWIIALIYLLSFPVVYVQSQFIIVNFN